MFDLKSTQELSALFNVPTNARDGGWQNSFYLALPDASLRALNPQVIEGPDGFSYFALAFPKEGQDFESFSINHILDFCLAHGFGIVLLNPPQKEPLWVFRYGDLLSFRHYKRFDGDPADEMSNTSGTITIDSPAEAVLPQSARNVIRTFLKKHAALSDPAVALYTTPSLAPSRNLVFNLYRAEFQKPDDYDRVMHQLLWFLPRTRGVVEASPSFIQPSQFEAL